MKKIISIIVVTLLVFTLCSCSDTNKGTLNEPTTKNIKVEVIANEKSEMFQLETSSETLGEALVEYELASGDKGSYGLYIKTVNGITADEKNEEWWCVTKNNETLLTGADSTPISDGDKFELTLKRGY